MSYTDCTQQQVGGEYCAIATDYATVVAKWLQWAPCGWIGTWALTMNHIKWSQALILAETSKAPSMRPYLRVGGRSVSQSVSGGCVEQHGWHWCLGRRNSRGTSNWVSGPIPFELKSVVMSLPSRSGRGRHLIAALIQKPFLDILVEIDILVERRMLMT